MKVLIKYIFLVIMLLIIINLLEYGLLWERIEHYIYPSVLTIISLIILLKPVLRKLFLVLAFCLLGLMVLVYLFNELNLANLVGSFGFALLLIVVSSYIPQIIKEGFVEKF